MNRNDTRPASTRTSPAPVSRRRMLLGAGAAFALVGCSDDPSSEVAGPSTDRPGTTTTTASPSTIAAVPAPSGCILSPELTAGPYYLDAPLARVDITEGRPGTPLEFTVRVLALPDCKPLAGAAVDIWHCDAGGEYSGFNGNSLEETKAAGRNDKRFLRGVQLTDADGVARFTTIFPGWYEGRTVHIHLKVLEGGEIGETYRGGHVAHVGQAFFDEAVTAQVLGAAPYTAHTGMRTTNDQDSIFAQAGPGAITATIPRDQGGAAPRDQGSTAPRDQGGGAGQLGTFTCIVDPTATPTEAPLF